MSLPVRTARVLTDANPPNCVSGGGGGHWRGGGTKLARVLQLPLATLRTTVPGRLQATFHRRLRPLGPAGRPGSCAPFYGHRVLASAGEWAETCRGHHPLISLLQACRAPLEGKPGCLISLPGSGLGHPGTVGGLKGAQQGRGSLATRQAPSEAAPPHLSHQAPRLQAGSQSLGPGGRVCPASLPERRSGCATRAANSFPRRIPLLPGPQQNSHRSACPPWRARSLCPSRRLPLKPQH